MILSKPKRAFDKMIPYKNYHYLSILMYTSIRDVAKNTGLSRDRKNVFNESKGE